MEGRDSIFVLAPSSFAPTHSPIYPSSSWSLLSGTKCDMAKDDGNIDDDEAQAKV
jgi:hypothetical protein